MLGRRLFRLQPKTRYFVVVTDTYRASLHHAAPIFLPEGARPLEIHAKVSEKRADMILVESHMEWWEGSEVTMIDEGKVMRD